MTDKEYDDEVEQESFDFGEIEVVLIWLNTLDDQDKEEDE
jgi:hypothetical protein